MDHDDKLEGHILSRREALSLVGAAGIGILAGCGGGNSSVSSGTGTGAGSGTTTGTSTGTTAGLVVTPLAIEGPFFIDENLNRSDLVTPGVSRATVANGVPLTLNLNVYSLSGTTGTALLGAHVDIWHCDTIGAYSDEASGNIQGQNTVGQNWLRGYQVVDSTGLVTFKTIIPGWYTGRTTHIHMKIRTYNASNNVTNTFTTQLFFTDTFTQSIYQSNAVYQHGTRTVFNATDNVYSVLQADGTAVGSHLMLNVTQSGAGYIGAFTVAFAASGA